MPSSIPPPINPLVALVELLEIVSRDIAREAKKRAVARRPRVKRGATLRPGVETPLWNALIAAIQPTLKRRGAKAILARELGVHRARVGEFFNRKTTMPDAERTLRLLVLLSRSARERNTPSKTAAE